MQSIGEMWARSVNDKTQPKQPQQQQQEAAPIKPVKDDETEKMKAQFRQNILKTNNKQKEQPNG